jgi:hypothetical protein
MESSKSPRRWSTFAIAVSVVLLAAAWTMRGTSEVRQDVSPTVTSVDSVDQSDELPRTRESSIADVLELAHRALASMEETLDDYTARFVKQERLDSGVLSEKTEMDVKIQTRLRNESNDAPMRIYLKFLAPEATKGREVIWGKDLYDEKMAVHETTMLLSWKTLWLDPTGMLAMAGQRYPIYEIGVTGLVEKLIERGKKDLNNPDVTVTITRDHEYDGQMCELIQARRARPGGGEDDFSLAEIIYDPERLLILSYQSFGWPDKDSADAEVPLLEFYQYRNLQTNVGLTEKDFDVTIESYGFP